MLIEFRVTNYRSFRETQKFSMVSGPGVEHLGTNTFDCRIPDLRLLRSAAVYGANAAGKTNLLRALQFMQNFIVNSAASSLITGPTPHDPFKFDLITRNSISEYEVAFIQDGIRYEYGFAIGPDRVEKEWLIEYPRGRARRLFDRQFNKSKSKDEWKFSSYFRGNRVVWSEATRPNALFLSTAVQLNSIQLLPVAHWFQRKLVVVVGTTTVNQLLTIKFLDEPTGKSRLLSFMREADPGIADVDLRREPLLAGTMMFGMQDIIEPTGTPGAPPNVIKITFAHRSKDSASSTLDLKEESNGTQILFRMAGAWLNVLANGEIFLIDEIETSLHPLLTTLLIANFHSDTTNPNNAQLIFTTHNTSLLNQELFRRDQIWFVEKDQSGATTLFPLTDFSPRNDEAIERGYLRGRYGALPVLSEFP
jgi:AAA15 family ATPase/GTPase